jgi:CheY-like chemotaxis protein
MVENPDDAAITLAMINLAHSLNLKVVAEGVENEAQINVLALHGCDEIQGFYFSKALPAPEIEAMVRAGRRLTRSQNFIEAKPAVLLLDDSESDLELLQRALAGEDFPVLAATSAQQAFVLLANHPVGVVVSDQRMPGMNGSHFLAKLGTLYPRVLRVAITGSADYDVVADAVNQAGIHKFLSKTWDRERLRTEIREAYQRSVASSKAG